jgi:predicted lipoprotein with Yx(FWY)xxD motif
MHKKNISTLLTLIIIIIVVVVGGYALLHKPSKDMPDPSSSLSATHKLEPMINNSIVITKDDSNLGYYLAEPNGSPLYTYNGDTSGISNCTGSCLNTWPAYVDSGDTQSLPNGLGAITRTDNGDVQFTFKGMPLYTFSGDSNGQINGNGENGFSLARP